MRAQMSFFFSLEELIHGTLQNVSKQLLDEAFSICFFFVRLLFDHVLPIACKVPRGLFFQACQSG